MLLKYASRLQWRRAAERRLGAVLGGPIYRMLCVSRDASVSLRAHSLVVAAAAVSGWWWEGVDGGWRRGRRRRRVNP